MKYLFKTRHKLSALIERGKVIKKFKLIFKFPGWPNIILFQS